MDSSLKDLFQSKLALKEIQNTFSSATKKHGETEKALANAMRAESIKSLQDFKNQITMNVNADVIRIYYWKQTYEVPTEMDITNHPNLKDLLRQFYDSRNVKNQLMQRIEEYKSQIDRRVKRIITTLPAGKESFKSNQHHCTIKINRKDSSIRIYKHRQKET
jgi:hypothetical protein